MWVLMGMFLWVSPAWAAGPSLIGQPEPEWTLPDIRGSAMSSSAFRDKIVLLHFWASWCASCKKELSSLRALAAHFKPDDFVVLMINSGFDDTSKISPLALDPPPNMRWLMDVDAKVATLHRVRGLPVSFLIDRQGVVRREYPGPQDFEGKKMMDAIRKLLPAP